MGKVRAPKHAGIGARTGKRARMADVAPETVSVVGQASDFRVASLLRTPSRRVHQILKMVERRSG